MTLGITFSAGNRVTGAQLQAMVNQIDSLTAPGWPDYGSDTTTLTAVTTNPTKGNSTYLARYRRPANSDYCDFEIAITIGSSFVAGTGAYRFLLPFAADTSEPMTYAGAINESGVALRVGGTNFVDTTHFEAWYDSAGGTISSSGLSTTWTTGDRIAFAGRYRVA